MLKWNEHSVPHIQVDELVAIAGQAMLEGVTVQNARERATVLKRHAQHASLDGKWAEFREILKEDDELLDAAI